MGGRDRPEWVVGIDRNRWSRSIGNGGRHQSEMVVAISRNMQISVTSVLESGQYHRFRTQPSASKGKRIHLAFSLKNVAFLMKGAVKGALVCKYSA